MNEEKRAMVRRYLRQKAREHLQRQITARTWPQSHWPTMAPDGPPRQIAEQQQMQRLLNDLNDYQEF